ncbi:MAG: TonB-dependent receptor [Xanthomonadaceae bacterium]|nr:TonB-dependent receptor [Xanthomonadaceae bacterium]
MQPKTCKLNLVFILILALFFLAATGGPAVAGPDNLGMLTLDQLLDVDVVSAAKVPEKIRNTPAAIFVITQEDLHRSGVNSIPEALRLVPGMHVYRIDANKWAISSRGFTSQFSNKMLVMIDGRTVYSPLFSGVYWDVQDMMLADIDRIEVIRGPGGSLWGTNAVNGIINIISKNSADTQGFLTNMEAGSHDRNTVSARYGGWLDEYTSYRIYGKYFNRDDFEPLNVFTKHDIAEINSSADDYHAARAGFHLDRNKDSDNAITLQGDVYNGSSGTTASRPGLLPPYLFPHREDTDVSGGNILGRWKHIFSQNADMKIQTYYDRTKRKDMYFRETRDTVDVDLQHRFTPWDHHELLWGLEYRYSKDHINTYNPADGFYFAKFDPDSQGNNLYTGFIQDRFRFAKDQGEVTVGTKVEHNEYTGTEWQPSIRFLWKFSDRNSIWAAITRSVRTPSRLEHDGSINTRPLSISIIPPYSITMVPRLVSNDGLDSEKVVSYELGYKSRPSDNLYVDITTFYNHYRNLAAGFTTGNPFQATGTTTPYMIVPMMVGNHFDAETFGIELSGNWSVTTWWRLSAGFSWFENNFLDENGITDPRAEFQENNESNYQMSLVSYMDLPGRLEFNGMLFYVDQLEDMDIDSYVRCDLNLAWHATDNLTITTGARNLFDPDHPEHDGITSGIIGSEIPRTFYGKLSWSF